MERLSEIRIDSGFGLVDALSVELRRRGLTVVATCTTHMLMPMTTSPFLRSS